MAHARRMADEPQVAITYFGLAPDAESARRGAAWVGLSSLPPVAPRLREEIDAALETMRGHVDR